jgi:hypothetical protein
MVAIFILIRLRILNLIPLPKGQFDLIFHNRMKNNGIENLFRVQGLSLRFSLRCAPGKALELTFRVVLIGM